MNKKENSGYQKTHQRIKDCFLLLIKDRELKELTVGALCQEASINRSTFYAHFTDVYEVMEQIQQDKEEELKADYSAVRLMEKNLVSREFIEILVNHIGANRDFYRAMLSESNLNILNQNMKLLETQIFQPVFEHLGLTKREGMYHFLFVKEGLLAILRQWITDGCPEDPGKLATIIAHSIPVPSVDIKFW